MTATNGLALLAKMRAMSAFMRTQSGTQYHDVVDEWASELESLLGGWRPIEELDETVLPPPIRVFYFPRWLGSNSDYSGERWHGETTFDLKTLGRRKATMFYELPTPPEADNA